MFGYKNKVQSYQERRSKEGKKEKNESINEKSEKIPEGQRQSCHKDLIALDRRNSRCQAGHVIK
jgi:hypothetical protein